jgi:hypothetical protein
MDAEPVGLSAQGDAPNFLPNVRAGLPAGRASKDQCRQSGQGESSETPKGGAAMTPTRTPGLQTHGLLPVHQERVDHDDFAIMCSDGTYFALARGRSKENAPFIVRACNSHDALVEACRGTYVGMDQLAKLCDLGTFQPGLKHAIADWMEARALLLHAALALAEGGGQ